MGKTIKTIATSAGFLFLLQCLGCGPGTTQAASDQQTATPDISQVLPQSIAAGSQSMTIKVTGTNFSSDSAVLWNGAALPTTVVDANTLSSTVGSSSLTTPTTVELQVQDKHTKKSSKTVPVTITGAGGGPTSALSISIASLPQGVVGSSYSGNFTAVGGASPYTWSVSSGQLPPGLSLSSSTGTLSGTPTASGNYNFGIKLIDSSSSVQSATTTVSLPVVTTAPVTPPLSIISTSIPAGTIGSAYSTVLQSSGGTAPYAWSITAGGLPNGLSFSATTGLISGTPTAVGTTNFTAAIADSSNPAQTKSVQLTLVIAATPLGITTSSLPSGTIGSTYTNLLQATGGIAPYTWSIASGNLPAGLSLTSATGIISGTPTTAGTFSFTATAADAGSPAQSKSVSLSIVIAPVTLAISTSALPSGTQNSSYSGALQAFGGTGTYTWSIASGTLPAGLALAPSTGVVSGTPTSSGNTSFKVTVSDTGSPVQSASATISLSIVAAGTPLAISSTSLPTGKPNKPYNATLNATGGTSPYTWSITSGSLPSGLSLASTTGVISGKTTASSSTSLTFQVTDSSSTPQTKSATLTLAIAPTAIAITSSALSSGTKGSSYSGLLQASGGTTPYTWSISAGSLPAGLSLAPSTGLITGTPTATGTTNFTVTVADAGNPVQTASATTSIVVAAPAPPTLAITTSSMPAGTNGTSYSNALQASGGTSPYAWSITAGSLPAGLNLNQATGLISGTPTANGTSSFTATVTDGGSPVQSKSVPLSIVVAAASPQALTINATLPSATASTGYSSAMTATGGTPAYTWSISAGSLPPGLTLAATSGTISGTPSTSGTYSFTATVTDNSSPTAQTKSAATSIVVAAATTSGSGTIWHIRHDGGDNVQCTGTTNAAYPGSGTGMACAYNHPYQMLSPSGGWTSFAAGDTMEFDDPPSNTTPYYMGEQNGGVGMDWKPTVGGICPGPNSPASQGASCILPILPSGVTIKGQNYGSCHTANHTGLVNPTILSGLNGAFAVLQVGGTSNVTISCIEVTQPDTCTSAGTGHGPGQCTSTNNYVGYAGLMLQYQTAQGPSNMTLTDFAVVGTSNRGIMGSHLNLLSSDTFTASDIYLIGNGQAGWDGDGGGCDNSCESVGTMNISYADIEWNGCMAVKPYNIGITPETAPNSFNYCYGQNTSGYGDGFVQLAAGNLTLNMTHSMFKYNTQDGFDGAHLSDDPNTSPATNISYSWSEGNAGQTFKIGAGASSTAINNVSISNCHILSQSSAFPNNPSGWIPLDGGDTCRAAGDEWALTLRPNASITLENNTSLGYGTTMYDIECSPFVSNCNGGTVVFTNNISKGFPDPSNGNVLASGIYLGPGLSSANVATASFNLWDTMHTGCPSNILPQETHFVCADPLLAGESNIDAINPSLTSTSPAIGAGVSINGITTDYNGVTRPSPPSIGAEEPPQ